MSTSQPAIVLVHGAWADACSWNASSASLQADGFTVYAPPNPLQGLPYDTGTISSSCTPSAASALVLSGTPTAGRSSPTPRPGTAR